MPDQSFAIFDTAIGACGIVWTARGICGVPPPERDAGATRARVHRGHPAAVEAVPTPGVQHAIDGIIALLTGEKRDLSDIVIDDERQVDFNRRVYAIARKIPPGATMTYG